MARQESSVQNAPSPELVTLYLQEELQQQIPLLPAAAGAQEIYRYGAFIGAEILCHRSLPRAMDFARDLIQRQYSCHRSIASGTVILADQLGQAKGRFTRTWHAPRGGIWGCLIHADTLLPKSRQIVPLAAGVAACQAVRMLLGDRAVLRWVNDVLVGGQKVAGFLVESYTEPIYGEDFTLVGFGINVNNSCFPKDIAAQAVSLSACLGETVSLTDFCARFLAKLAWNFGLIYHEEARYLRGDGYSGESGEHLVLASWRGLSDTIGRHILYGFDVITAPQYRGRALGIDGDGGLQIRLEDGFEKTEYSGEIRYLEAAGS